MIAGVTGFVSAFIGTYLGSIKNGFPNGRQLFLPCFSLCLYFYVVGGNGIVRQIIKEGKQMIQILYVLIATSVTCGIGIFLY